MPRGSLTTSLAVMTQKALFQPSSLDPFSLLKPSIYAFPVSNVVEGNLIVPYHSVVVTSLPD